MKIYEELIQGTEEWLEVRRGVITASECGDWLAEPRRCLLTIPEIKRLLVSEDVDFGGSSKKSELEILIPNPQRFLAHTVKVKSAQLKLIYTKLAESTAPDEMQPWFGNWATERGTKLEPVARAEYEKLTGEAVEEVGFVLHKCGRLGCSPDGFVDNRQKLLEIKCPLPQTHIKYLHEKVLPNEYKIQCHHQMAVTGCRRLDFFSYCPRLKPLKISIDWDDFTERVLDGLLGTVDLFYEVSAELNSGGEAK